MILPQLTDRALMSSPIIWPTRHIIDPFMFTCFPDAPLILPYLFLRLIYLQRQL